RWGGGGEQRKPVATCVAPTSWIAPTKGCTAARLYLGGGAGGVRDPGAGADLAAGHVVGRCAPGEVVGRSRARGAARAVAACRRGGRPVAGAGPAQRHVRGRPLPLDARDRALRGPAAAAAGVGRSGRAKTDATLAAGALGRRRGSAPPAAAALAALRAARPAGSVRGGRAMNRVRGFTLVEVLLATGLLASGLALAFATIRAATATAERGERMRAVQGSLRARLLAARPVPWGIDEDTGLARRFIGDGTRMAFVADLPDYLGRGGPYLHRLEVAGPPGQRRIEVVFEVV